MANNQYEYNGIEMKLGRYLVMISGGDGCDPLTKMFLEAEPSDEVSILCMMLDETQKPRKDYFCFRDAEHAQLAAESKPPEPADDEPDDADDEDGDDEDAPEIDIRRKHRDVNNAETKIEYVATVAVRDDHSNDILLYTIHHRVDGYLVNNEIMPLEKIYLLFSEHNAKFRADTLGTIEDDSHAMNQFLLFEMTQRGIRPIDWRAQLAQLYKSRDTTGDVGFEFADGSVVRAHRIALTHTSKMFEGMLDGSVPKRMSPAGNYILDGTDAKNFEHVLRYVYTGEVDWPALPSVAEFIRSADYLRVEALVEQLSLDPPQSKPSGRDGNVQPGSAPRQELAK